VDVGLEVSVFVTLGVGEAVPVLVWLGWGEGGGLKVADADNVTVGLAPPQKTSSALRVWAEGDEG
jgi:hypothetical protein